MPKLSSIRGLRELCFFCSTPFLTKARFPERANFKLEDSARQFLRTIEMSKLVKNAIPVAFVHKPAIAIPHDGVP